jgi:tryptophan-rich sensory protein
MNYIKKNLFGIFIIIWAMFFLACGYSSLINFKESNKDSKNVATKNGIEYLMEDIVKDVKPSHSLTEGEK